MKARALGRTAATIAGMLLLSHCAQVPVGSGKNVVPMPEPQEIELGAQASRAVLEEYAPTDNAALQAYVNEVGRRLARQSARAGLPWHFTVVDSSDVTAFSLPGGHVYLSRGILAYLDSEAELAAVIGHEIGHVAAHHGLHPYATAAAPAPDSVLAPQREEAALGHAWARTYGPDEELEADRLAAGYLAAAGYSPAALIDAFAALKNQAAAASALGRQARPYHALVGAQPDEAQLARVAARARVAAKPRDGRDDYLQKLEGVDFGDSPEQGVLRHNLLLHERLGLAIQFPPDWQVHNRADRVVATNHEGDALLELQAGPKRARPLETLQKAVKLDAGAHYDSGRLGGYPAAFAAGTQAGKPVVVAAVVLDGTQYLLAGMARDMAAYDRERSALRAAINSFHAITSAEKKAARTYTLRRITASPGQTIAELARKSPLGAEAELQLRLMNGLYPSGEPELGQPLKIVQ